MLERGKAPPSLATEDATACRAFLRRPGGTSPEMVVPVDGRQPNPEFVLNQPAFAGARILPTRDNLGCGASCEHAPWALRDFGLRALIAPSLAAIFHAHCFKNGILPVTLEAATVQRLFELVRWGPGIEFSTALDAQTVTPAGCEPIPLAIAPERIRRYEAGRRTQEP